MKRLAPLLSFLVLASCSQSEAPDVNEAFGVPAHRLVERNGLRYYLDSELLFTGSTVRFRKNGLMRSRVNYKDGKQDGLFEMFYADGRLQSRSNFKDGKQDGLAEVFWENGQLRTRENFTDGKKDGLFEWAGQNGEVVRTENWKDGVKTD
jgi:antitoxin component YwqK of YwqJK toxin-antitoxin module